MSALPVPPAPPGHDWDYRRGRWLHLASCGCWADGGPAAPRPRLRLVPPITPPDPVVPRSPGLLSRVLAWLLGAR